MANDKKDTHDVPAVSVVIRYRSVRVKANVVLYDDIGTVRYRYGTGTYWNLIMEVLKHGTYL